MPITLNSNARALPFACRVDVRTFMQMLIDIARQGFADGIRRLVIVNGHGGNTQAIGAALRELSAMDDVPFACAVSATGMADESARKLLVHPSEHGGEQEVALVMHLRPDLVRPDKVADNPFGQLAVEALKDPRVTFVRPWHLACPASAAGDQRQATAAKGEALVASAARAIGRLLVELSQAPAGAAFPYA